MSSGARSRYRRQNCLKTIESETKCSVAPLAPAVELLDYEHPQDHLHRCGVPPEPFRVGVAFEKICLNE